jgi:acetyl esterase/lipase
MKCHSLVVSAAALTLLSAAGAVEPPVPNVTHSIEYARVGSHPLLLDLHRGETPSGGSPVVIWVHGGAWRSGSRTNVPIAELCMDGFAIASVDYRLSVDAAFPAQVHDIKAAIRFLKANSDKYALDPDHFFIAGASAGGHLAALVGVSAGVQELEGDVGQHLSATSNVRAIVSFYGASNLQSILSQSTPHGLSVRVPALQLLLRGQPEQLPKLARLASPVAHVDRNDPPLLLIHGDQDRQMPINQSHELHGAYKKAGLDVVFRVVHGGAHGGAGFYDREQIQMVFEFLRAR